MPGAGDLTDEQFSAVLGSPATDFPLFAPPSEPITDTKYAIGLHARASFATMARCRSASGRLATRWRRG